LPGRFEQHHQHLKRLARQPYFRALLAELARAHVHLKFAKAKYMR
jgi:hypothetical protein